MNDPSPAGERILAAATEIFYTEGIGAVGVDRIAAEAAVTKPTLYAQFGSKANLIAAVLDRRSRDRQAAIESMLADFDGDAEARLLAVFDWLAEGHGKSGFRGCPFINAAVELPDARHPARLVILDYKRWLRTMLTSLASAAGAADPERLGSDLQLLIDGANARVVVEDDRSAMRDARRVASSLLASDLSNRRTSPREA
ncbi:TetR/AcrR family transcriptional regulator [Mycobacterium sp. CPCC 205710]|uniref:TetR/AcrR family transcriptional regulator n=1 Tax=Mycobacterium deserti TaxID=2978347 RepID=A0ABT2MIM2_9MYCO|nr:TetR/AcrR family transcriptional regulator [Mycobacterium deserti]